MLNFVAICPHSPVLIPEIGASQIPLARKTLASLETLALDLKKAAPHTIVIVSPHGPMRYDKFIINLEDSLKGSFTNFGFSNLDFNFLNDNALTQEMLLALRHKQFPIDIIRERNLDYGTLVPLFHLLKFLDKKPRIVPLTFTALDWATHYQYGQIIGRVFEQTDYNVTFIASADLSQRLTDNAPAGFSPYGVKFDHTLTELLKKNEIKKILNLNPEFCTEAGECGLRSVLMALGVINETKYTYEQISYESPFGTGFLSANWKIKK